MKHRTVSTLRLPYILPSLLFLCSVSAAVAQNIMSLPAGQVGKSYSKTVQAEGGLAPLKWKVADGRLPKGLNLSADGVIHGIPTEARRAAFIFVLQVTDSSVPAQTATMRFSIAIKAAPLRIIGVVPTKSRLKIIDPSASSSSSGSTRPSSQDKGPTSNSQTTGPGPVRTVKVDTKKRPGIVKAPRALSKDPCAAAKSLPAILGKPVDGQTTLSGCTDTGMSSVQIEVVPQGAKVQCATRDLTQFAARPLPFATRQDWAGSFDEFTAVLSTPLKTGQQVCLEELPSNGSSPHWMNPPAVVTTAPPAPVTTGSCATATAPFIPGPLIRGQKVVSGCAGTRDRSMSVIVGAFPRLLSPLACPVDAPSISSTSSTNATEPHVVAAYVDPTGTFSAELQTPLKDRDSVCVWQVSGKTTIKRTPSPTPVTKWAYNQAVGPLGRTNYFLAGGVALSQDNQQFSSQNPYLDFEMDRNWLRGRWWFLNSGFSAQLTSIPTVVTPVSSNTTTTSGGLASPKGRFASATSNTTPTTNSVNAFISSRKAAVVSGDTYFPIYLSGFKWWYEGGSTLFIAPLVKGGIQTITSGSLNVSAPVPGTTNTTATQTIDNAGLYPFWAAGLRFGDMKLPNSWNIAPRILSHLDMTIGKWTNFRQCRYQGTCTISLGMPATGKTYVPWLFSMEGRLDIPHTPLEIGLNSTEPLTPTGQGNLQFLFGVRFNIGCVYQAYVGNGTPSYSSCVHE